MNPSEILRLVDSLHREKDIDTEVVFTGIEAALISAARKHFGASEGLVVTIDRETGEVHAQDGETVIDPSELGRIAAQTAKQVMIQKIREAERESITHEFADRINTVVTGAVQRFEGPNIVVNLQRTEGFLPKSEQIYGETYHVGERVRALVLEVRNVGSRVRVVLTRTHPEFVKQLFALDVPEVADGTVEIRGLAREAGYRTKIAVDSVDPRVDCVGACVGVQGSRIRSIVDELNGERIDIVRWNDEIDLLIANTLKPAELQAIELDEDNKHALVIVPDDQLSLAIGKRGQNVRLAAKLTGWDIDIQSTTQLTEEARREAESEQAEAAGQEAAAPEAETQEDGATEEKAPVEAEPEAPESEAAPPGAEADSKAPKSDAADEKAAGEKPVSESHADEGSPEPEEAEARKLNG